MPSLYPSLEDFKYDILMNSNNPSSSIGTHLRYLDAHLEPVGGDSVGQFRSDTGLYPSFSNNIGSICTRSSANSVQSNSSMVAPLSGYSQAHKLQPSNAIRPVIVCKDASGKVGLRLGAIHGGVFVILVYASSPAASAKFRFGDQILEINDIPVAGYSMQKVHDLIRKSPPGELRFSVRDRPFERTVTLHKDQNGLVGFVFNKHGRIINIVKDSSAARNGLLIDHSIMEVNGQNIVGLDEADIRGILDNCGDVVILTIMPSKIFDLMVKQTNHKLLKRSMDHAEPEI